MTMVVTGTVEFPTSEQPFEGRYGPKYNIAVRPDNPNAPKTNSEGLIKIYKNPEHVSVPFMKSLKKGDPIQLVYIDKGGSMKYYDLVFDSTSTQPVSKVETPEVMTHTPYAPAPQKIQQAIVMPYSDEETATVVQLCLEQSEIILDIMRQISGDKKMQLSVEDKRAIAVTAYIQVNRTRPRGAVLEEFLGDDELFDDEPPVDDMNQDISEESASQDDDELKLKTFVGLFERAVDDKEDVEQVAHGFIKVVCQMSGLSDKKVIRMIKDIGLNSELVKAEPVSSFEIVLEFLHTEESADRKAAVQYAEGLVQELSDEVADGIPF